MIEESRPARLGDVNLHEAVGAVRETADLTRVYRPEWLIAHTAPDLATATTWLEEHAGGRVRDEDRAVVTGDEHSPWYAQLRLPNLKGEFKHRDAAERYVAEQGWDDAVLVARSSRAEHELLGYGKRKLVD